MSEGGEGLPIPTGENLQAKVETEAPKTPTEASNNFLNISLREIGHETGKTFGQVGLTVKENMRWFIPGMLATQAMNSAAVDGETGLAAGLAIAAGATALALKDRRSGGR